MFLRGNVLTLEGEADAVDTADAVVRELSELIAQGHEIAPGTIEAVTRALDAHESPARILEDVVWRHRATKVAPKTVNQKRYVDSIRNNTITFGIGPAGTGKTFLAVALAAAALSRREVNRIILTRPAVEAGERLGFLPGDLMAKVDPYLRPLFDALHDMLDPDRVTQYLERGVIEVAPLAFMRGSTPQRQLHHPRRGAEHQPRADEDVPHPAGIQLEDGRHRRRHPDRSARASRTPAWWSSRDILKDVEGIEFVRFGEEDVVRHKLVRRIVEAYAEHAQRAGARAAAAQAGMSG